jgi:hypothetical protein
MNVSKGTDRDLTGTSLLWTRVGKQTASGLASGAEDPRVDPVEVPRTCPESGTDTEVGVLDTPTPLEDTAFERTFPGRAVPAKRDLS